MAKLVTIWDGYERISPSVSVVMKGTGVAVGVVGVKLGVKVIVDGKLVYSQHAPEMREAVAQYVCPSVTVEHPQ